MADFYKTYNEIIKIEGTYSYDSDDPGGETYKGISRVKNPNWYGWRLIEHHKDIHKDNWLFFANRDNQLNDMVFTFYKKNYFDKFNGDDMQQELANEMFDIAINIGVTEAIKFLQRTVNLLNKNQRYYKNITVDGVYGPETLNTLTICIKRFSNKLIVNILNGFQIKHYIELMERNEKFEKYIGWFNRIKILPG